MAYEKTVGDMRLDERAPETIEYMAGEGLALDGREFSADRSQVSFIEDQGCVSYGNRGKAVGSRTKSFTDWSSAEGASSSAGTRSFGLLSGSLSAKTFKLTSVRGIQPGYAYSLRLESNYGMVGNVVAVSAETNQISVDRMPSGLMWYEFLSALPEGCAYRDPSGDAVRGVYGITADIDVYADDGTDTNTLWIPGKPALGDLSVYSTASKACGWQAVAQKQCSFAEGCGTLAEGKYSHAEGLETSAAYAAHSEGRFTAAKGEDSHAEGMYAFAEGDHSHAAGYYAWANHRNSWCWNGAAYISANMPYNRLYSHGEGTFNINPRNGISGFYIGGTSLYGCLSGLDARIDAVESQLSGLDVLVDTILGD